MLDSGLLSDLRAVVGDTGLLTGDAVHERADVNGHVPRVTQPQHACDLFGGRGPDQRRSARHMAVHIGALVYGSAREEAGIAHHGAQIGEQP